MDVMKKESGYGKEHNRLLYYHTIGKLGEEKFMDEIFKEENFFNSCIEKFEMDIVKVDEKILNKECNIFRMAKYTYAVCEVKTTYNMNKMNFGLNGTSGMRLYEQKRLGKPVCLGVMRIKERLPIGIVDRTYEEVFMLIENKVRMEFYPENVVEFDIRNNTMSANKRDPIILEDFGGIRPELKSFEKKLIGYGRAEPIKEMVLSEEEIKYLMCLYDAEYYYVLERSEEAFGMLDEAMRINPDGHEVTELLAEMLLKFCDKDGNVRRKIMEMESEGFQNCGKKGVCS